MKRFTTFALAAALLVAAASVSKGQDGKAEEGKPAPAIKLPATSIDKVLPDAKDKKTLSLEDLKGKNVVLFFYPKALTKGCTIESCGFRDKKAEFDKLDTVLIGISNDTVAKQQEFTDKEKLPYPLFADVDKKVSMAYGTANDKGGPKRQTFVIDKKGVLRKIYTKVTPANHPQEVLDYVKKELK